MQPVTESFESPIGWLNSEKELKDAQEYHDFTKELNRLGRLDGQVFNYCGYNWKMAFGKLLEEQAQRNKMLADLNASSLRAHQEAEAELNRLHVMAVRDHEKALQVYSNNKEVAQSSLLFLYDFYVALAGLVCIVGSVHAALSCGTLQDQLCPAISFPTFTIQLVLVIVYRKRFCFKEKFRTPSFHFQQLNFRSRTSSSADEDRE